MPPGDGSRPLPIRASIAGYLFLAAGLLLLLGIAAYIKYNVISVPLIVELTQLSPKSQSGLSADDAMSALLFERWMPPAILTLLAFLCFLVSYNFFQSSGALATGIVAPLDREMIYDAVVSGKPEPIDQYIRLASLSGISGVFTKIGLNGLPLATILLVIFFALMSYGLNPGIDHTSKAFEAFLDLTKLTLGAFIGSYVQRTVERRTQEAELQKVLTDARRASTGNDGGTRGGGSSSGGGGS
jgi:hypothetical protein